MKGLLPQRKVWIAVLRLTILLGPSYFAAYLTGEMVWVVPTLAGSGAVAASVVSLRKDTTVRVDEDGGDDGDAGEEASQHAE